MMRATDDPPRFVAAKVIDARGNEVTRVLSLAAESP
jgi:hypothetical protein